MLGKRNIFLIGPMGSGKTAVGRHLARSLRFTFYDSDADIEARTGVDIAFIFEKEGEPGFRVRERESIDRLTRLESIVLATGGGAVIDEDKRICELAFLGIQQARQRALLANDFEKRVAHFQHYYVEAMDIAGKTDIA